MYKRILVPVDGSAASVQGLDEAIKLAKNQKAALCLLHVVDRTVFVPFPEAGFYVNDMIAALEEAGRDILKKAQTKVRARGLTANAVLYKTLTRVADVVVRHAKKWRADVIVLGTHGRRGVTRALMGSDAELIVRYSDVPVLLVHAKATGQRRKKR